MWIDLHIHSTFSDGTYGISKIIDVALEQNVKVISITDHDTVNGVEKAIELGNEKGVKVIPGIELTTYFYDIETHILGYFIDYKNKEFIQLLDEIRKKRNIRNAKIITKLNSLGFDMSIEELEKSADGIIGRPHIASIMLEKGYISEFKEAFNLYLGEGKSAYYRKYNLPAKDGIKLIHKYGGIAILAHPFSIPNYEYVIELLIKDKLDGFEMYCTNLDNIMFRLKRIYQYHPNLIVTGGSDFHRLNPLRKNNIGSRKIPYKVYEKIENKYHKLMKKKR